jgi:hypothetical protein
VKEPIDMMLDGLAWTAAPPREPSPDGIPHVTHSGLLEMPAGAPLRVYQLSSGQRIIDADDLAAFFEAFR